MGVIALTKAQIFGFYQKQDLLLEELQASGLVQIRELEGVSYKKAKILSEEYLTKLSGILALLQKEAHLSFKDKTSIHYITQEEFQSQQLKLQENYDLIDQIENIRASIISKELELKELNENLKILSVLEYTDLKLSDIKITPYSKSILGKIKTEHISRLENLTEYFALDFDILSQTQEDTYILVFFYTNYSSELLNELKLLDFQEWTTLIPQTLSCKEFYAQLSQQKIELQNLLGDFNSRLQAYVYYLKPLEIFYDYLSNRVQKDLIKFYIKEDRFIFKLEVYIPHHHLKDLELILKKVGYCDYETVPLDEEEVLPSLIHNSKISQSFEFVTDMYSRPGTEDLDPTPFFAPFFALFMGMAIGDAGVGFILAVISWWASKKLRLEESTQKLLGICFYGGIMSIVMGIITGSYFSIPFEKLGVKIPYIYKPEKQIMLALSLSFIVGFIHITFGYCIRFMHLLKNGKFFAALCDGLFHIVIMICLLLEVLVLQFPSFIFLQSIILYTFIADLILIWATSGRHYSDTFMGRIMWGFYGVYELTAIFGDILSYARLFALGLAGGIIASAINELTPQLLSGIHFSSVSSSITAIIMIILFITILLVGHIFAAILAILGAFIHTMRLQFVEFFGKFFQGGGQAFKPLKITSKYFWIKKQDHHK